MLGMDFSLVVSVFYHICYFLLFGCVESHAQGTAGSLKPASQEGVGFVTH